MQLLFAPLIFAVLHKMQAGNAGVTVAVMGMTWFFNQALLLYSLTLIAALRLSEWAALSQQSNSGFILYSVVFAVFQMPEIWATKSTCFFIPFSRAPLFI